MSGRHALHASHAASDTRIKYLDAQVIEKSKLSANHVEDAQNREARGVSRTVWTGGIGRRRTGGAVAATKNVCANDKILFSVQRFSWTDERFPPPFCGVGRGACCVGGCAETGMEEDGVAFVGVESAPCLVGELEQR